MRSSSLPAGALKWTIPADSTKPWTISAPVQTIASSNPWPIMSHRTSPCFAAVIAPVNVPTTRQSGSTAISWSTSAASPS